MRNNLNLWVLVLFALAILAGCGPKNVDTESDLPEVDTTGTAARLAAQEKARQDSIRAALEAEQAAMEEELPAIDEEEQLRLQEEEERRAREEAERAAREARQAAERRAKESLRRIYFEFDQSGLSDQAREALRHNAEVMLQYPDWDVVIEGHCDERGSTEYNLALGERRAAAVQTYYIDYGVRSSQLRIVSYGEERPADPSHNETAWALNRRAVTAVR